MRHLPGGGTISQAGTDGKRPSNFLFYRMPSPHAGRGYLQRVIEVNPAFERCSAWHPRKLSVQPVFLNSLFGQSGHSVCSYLIN